jgi:hypothetical protein
MKDSNAEPKKSNRMTAKASSQSNAKAAGAVAPSLTPLVSLASLDAAIAQLASAAVEDISVAVAELVGPLTSRISALEARPSSALGAGRATQRSLDLQAPVGRPKAARSSLDPLPVKLTLASLLRYLEKNEFTVVNNRGNSGALWVKHEPRFKAVAAALDERGVSVMLKDDRKRHPGKWFMVDVQNALE